MRSLAAPRPAVPRIRRDDHRPTEPEVMAAVCGIRDGAPQVLPGRGPLQRRRAVGAAGGRLRDDEESSPVPASCREGGRARCEQASTVGVSRPDRVPGRMSPRVSRDGPLGRDPSVPADTGWHRSGRCRRPTFDHARDRGGRPGAAAGQMSTTTSLAPARAVYTRRWRAYSARSHPVSAKTAEGIKRQALLERPAWWSARAAGGRPAALFRLADRSLRVTDAFAVLRPPGEAGRGAVT